MFITEESKLANVRREHEALMEVYRRDIAETPELVALTRKLKEINSAIWDIEDNIRELERSRDFGESFIEVARSVYRTNDSRAVTKREINQLLNSRLFEEKSYVAY